MIEVPEDVDRRFEVRQLGVGWMFLSPAYRWETITDIDEGTAGGYEYAWRVWTDLTGPDYAWRLPLHDKVHAVEPIMETAYPAEPEIRIMDMPHSRSGGPQIIAVITVRTARIPDFRHALVTARYGGAGKGWEVSDRPAGGALVTTQHPSKARARTALMAAVRAHAKALVVPIRLDDPSDW